MIAKLVRTVSLLGSAVMVVGMTALPVLAVGEGITTTPITQGQLVPTIFNVVTIAAVVLFIILLLIGGIQYLGSFGNEEATTKARKLILDAVVGLFIVLAAGAIAGLVLNQLGVTGINVGGAGSSVFR